MFHLLTHVYFLNVTRNYVKKTSQIRPISSREFQERLDKVNANNVAERLRKMSIRFSVVIHTYNVLSHSCDKISSGTSVEGAP